MQIIFLSILSHLLTTPFHLYYLLFKTKNSIFIILESVWLFGHVWKLLLVVEPCQDCLNEVFYIFLVFNLNNFFQSNTTLILIYELLTFDLDNRTKTSLEMFSTHLRVCKIEFTAFGLTKIDRSLLAPVCILL